MMVDAYGVFITFICVLLNMLIVWLALAKADTIMNLFGVSGARAFSKIMYILLGAIGVMMIRHGIKTFLL
jgi:small neutral amino acid transporter SnatA (MarC family)